MKQIALLCGGRSAERDISFLSAASVLTQLEAAGYTVSVIGIAEDGSLAAPENTQERLDRKPSKQLLFPSGKDWIALLTQLDPASTVVFPVLHGPFGEDGTVQGTLEVLDLPYVGAGVCGSALAMNKVFSKIILKSNGLPVLPYQSVSWIDWQARPSVCLSGIEDRLSYPVFVKPANMGSSVGINRSPSEAKLKQHLEEAFQFDELVIIEQGISAREIEVAVLGNDHPRTSVAGEIIPSGEFYTYKAKYSDPASQLVIPAPLSRNEMEHVRDLALRTFKALGLSGMARVDFLLDKETEKLWVSEANTIPGFTAVSMYPKLWEATGLGYESLLNQLVDLALERHSRRAKFSLRS